MTKQAAKTLVIVESPAKAKTIGKFLGKKYYVKSSMGHIRDLPKSQLGVDIENGLKPKYITIRGKGDILKKLREAKKKADKILLASDPDREGEAIAWHLQKALKVPSDSLCRIEFNEITKDAIKEALKNPRQIDINRVDAQQARRVLDRLVGYKLSPLLWRKIKKGLSAGRVQSVAVKLICDREDEIEKFEPEEYWSLTANLKSEKKSKGIIEAKLYKIGDKKAEIKSQAEMDEILSELKNKIFLLEDIKRKEKRKNPLPPFTTSSLQQDAYRRLNFTAKKTMRIAQQLYEGIELGKEGSIGLITYIRTDSTRIADVAQKDAKEYIVEKFGKDYVPEKPRQYVSKKQAQEAHEAIRPTYISKDPQSVKNYLSRDQYRLYKLIWERFTASQMAAAIYDTTTFIIKAGNYEFRASGSIIKFSGFMEVYDLSNKEKDKILPDLEKGIELILEKLDPKQHFTQPPPRYSEALLVKTLEELGIGRPSTYAPIISTILDRGYVIREDKQLKPTELGYLVTEMLSEYFNEIIDVEFTANLEDKLDKIEAGKANWVEVVKEFYAPFSKDLEKAENEIGKIELEEEVSDEVCEKCGRNMVIKHGRYGKFLACPGFPDCRNTKPLLEEVGVKCLKCGGDIVVRKSKKGRIFYGCSNYPNCDFVSWKKPVGEKCPECGEILVEHKIKKGGEKIICSNKECSFEKPLEISNK
ncbi:MAG: topoisomerase [Clostridia bacterium]|jgi:DNA topoisomerase-1|nr:topoisomerase [Clostridia bacterium]